MLYEAKELITPLREYEVKLILKALVDREERLKGIVTFSKDEDAAAKAENDLIELNSFRSRFVVKSTDCFGPSVLNLSEELL